MVIYSRKLISVLALSLLLFSGYIKPVYAAPIINILKIDVLFQPEYDSPGVKVTLQGEIKNNGSDIYEEPIVFFLPQGVFIDMICELGPNGEGLAHNQYDLGKNDGGLQQVLVNLSKPLVAGGVFNFHIQYSYNPFSGAERNVVYTYLSSYATNKLNFIVWQPLRADNFQVMPGDYQLMQQDQFNIYHYEVNNIPASTNRQWQISYIKNDNQPSILATGNNNQASASGLSAGLVGGNNTLVALLVVGIVVLIALLGFMFVQRRSEEKHVIEDQPKARTKIKSNHHEIMDEKRAARQLLLNGKISEDTYLRIIREIENQA